MYWLVEDCWRSERIAYVLVGRRLLEERIAYVLVGRVSGARCVGNIPIFRHTKAVKHGYIPRNIPAYKNVSARLYSKRNARIIGKGQRMRRAKAWTQPLPVQLRVGLSSAPVLLRVNLSSGQHYSTEG